MNSKQWLIDLESKADAAMENWDKKYSEDFLLLHQGKGRGDEIMQARAALSRSKGE